MAILAMWISRDGTYFAMLRKLDGCYGHIGSDCGGSLGAFASDEEAIAVMQAQVDSAKILMERVGPIAPPIRVVSGPTYLDDFGAWEVTVNLPVYSDKLAYTAWCALPEFADFDGRIYRKGGMKAADCTACYWSRGK